MIDVTRTQPYYIRNARAGSEDQLECQAFRRVDQPVRAEGLDLGL
ncbi:hypothetical protein [Microbulbifer sp. S227A]